MNKKLGIALIAVAIIIVTAFVIEYVFESKTDEQDMSSNVLSTSEVLDDMTDEAESDPSTEEPEEVTFDNLDSPVYYDFHDEIKKQLDPTAFNKAFISYIKGKDYAPKTDSFTVRDDGIVTIDLENNVYMFDVQVQNEKRTVITVAVDSDGKYIFDD